MTEGNYTENDAIDIVATFVKQDPYPYNADDLSRKRIECERRLVIYAAEQGWRDGYTQREEGL